MAHGQKILDCQAIVLSVGDAAVPEAIVGVQTFSYPFAVGGPQVAADEKLLFLCLLVK